MDSEMLYTNTQRENYANEFSHYLKMPSFFIKTLAFIMGKPCVCFVGLLIAIMSFAGITIQNDLRYNSMNTVSTLNSTTSSPTIYYVTSIGKKFHKNHCKHIRYKTNIKHCSLDDIISEDYEPCLDCIGESIEFIKY